MKAEAKNREGNTDRKVCAATKILMSGWSEEQADKSRYFWKERTEGPNTGKYKEYCRIRRGGKWKQGTLK